MTVKIQQPFVYTCSPAISDASEIYQESIFYHSKSCLISLIHGLSSQNFGYDTLWRGCQHILHFKNNYLKNNEPFFLDSGGYTIISGQVSSRNTWKFIECYSRALEWLKDDIDYVFQLDIPIFLNEPENCTQKNIYEFNKKSLEISIDIIKKYPELMDKFITILQFKIKSQFKIWDYLYNELEVYKYHKYYAVGGLVSIYGICPHINFAPFIGPLYYWLYYYEKNSQYQYPFYIHILGTYHRFTRFIIIFMEMLFSNYLNKHNQKAVLTYDTINYTLSSMYKSKVGMDYYNLENNKLQAFHSHDLSDDLLSNIYKTESCLKSYHHNLERIDNGAPLTDTTFLVPLNISSQLNLDKFFESFITHHGLIHLFLNCKNYNEFKNKSNPIINSLQSYPTLTSNLVTQIKESLRFIYVFNQWYQKDKDDKSKLMDLMDQFINKINFPFDLT